MTIKQHLDEAYAQCLERIDRAYVEGDLEKEDMLHDALYHIRKARKLIIDARSQKT